MKPTTKTFIIIGCMTGAFAVPVIIIMLRDFIYLAIFVISFSMCLFILGYCGYQDLLLYIRREEIEEERIFHSFHGDLEKIRLYKGFIKFFAGNVSVEHLQEWFENHPRK